MTTTAAAVVNLQRIILVGSGDTLCTPNTTCLMKNIDEENKNLCQNCVNTQRNICGDINHRNQTSILLTFSNKKSILVDCGVTFRDSALKAFRTSSYEFPQICGYIATRNAPDSILGVDDIREVTMRGEKIALYAPSAVLDSLNKMFPYIMPSSKPQSANQKLLWVAGLTPIENGPLKQGAKFSFQTTSVSKKKKGENKNDTSKDEEEIPRDEVEIIAVGKSEKECKENCGFVISLEEDGKLVYPNYNSSSASSLGDGDDENNNIVRKSKVALYLPFDCLSSSNINDDDDDHYSTPPEEILKHFEIDLALIAFPKILSPSSSRNENEQDLVEKISNLIHGENSKWKNVKINKVVVVCLPHNVVTSSDENGKKNNMKSVVSFGYDTQCVWERSSS